MYFKAVFTVEKMYLRVDISGQRVRGSEVNNAKELFSQIADMCRQNDLSRILVVNRVEGKLDIITVFNIVKNPEAYGWARHFRLAYVDKNEESKEVSRLAETFAANRGYGLTRLFDNEEVAKKWLIDI